MLYILSPNNDGTFTTTLTAKLNNFKDYQKVLADWILNEKS
jgi:hypothetical protein